MSTDMAKEDVLPPELQALLDAAAREQSAGETSNIPIIRLKGKKFSIDGEKIGTAIRTVILANAFDHSWYNRPYDPSSEETYPPACFAIDFDDIDMVPHETAPLPQAERCNVCPKNEFKSHPNGKGKACSNRRRLLVALVDQEGRANFGNLGIVNISPTALRGMSKYIKGINTIKKLPLWAAITTLTFEEESSFPQIVPVFNGQAHAQDIEFISTRLGEFNDLVTVPYNVKDFEPFEGDQPAPAATEKKSKMG